MHTNIRIRSFTDASMTPYLPLVARLRLEVFRDYPYLRQGSLDTEREHLEKYCHCKEAIVIIVFDDSKVVGATTGIPLEMEPLAVQKPFLDKGLDPKLYYYFSDSALLKNYRRRGIGHHFFDLREQHVLKLGRFKHICFCTVVRPENDPLKPVDHMSLNDFWRKRGYLQHTELKCHFNWKDVGSEILTEKQMFFWVRDLPSIQPGKN